MHGEIFNAEMELVFLNSTDVTGKVIVTTEGMSTNVVSYIITKILTHFIYVGLPLRSEYHIISFFLRMC